MRKNCNIIVGLVVILLLFGIARQLRALEKEDILFYASFDGKADADIARGQKEVIVSGKPLFLPGRKGMGLAVNKKGSALCVKYPSKGNIRTSQGTLEMWVKPHSWSVSDADRIHRPFFIVYDPWILLYRYADGYILYRVEVPGYDAIPLNMWTVGGWKKGQWVHVAISWEPGEIAVFINGEFYERKKGIPPFSGLDFGDYFSIGPDRNWSKEGFDEPETVIDEVYIYKRSLTAAEIEKAYLRLGEKPPERQYDFEVELIPYFFHNELVAKIRPGFSPEKNIVGEYQMKRRTWGKFSEPAPFQLSPDGLTELTIPIADAAASEHTLKISFLDEAGQKVIAEKEITFFKPPEPVWFENKIGISDEVPAPWTPLALKDKKVKCWGREYDFGASVLPSQIISRGAELLSASPRIIAVRGNKSVRDELSSCRVISEKANEVVLKSKGRLLNIKIEVDTRLEYDGMVWLGVGLSPEGPIEVDSLKIEIPVRAKHSKLIHWWSGYGCAGALAPEGFHAGFIPYIWLGDNDRGLMWFAGSDRGWIVKERKKALQVIPRGDANVLTLSIIDHPARISKPIRIAFGLQATPVKPRPKNWRSWREKEAGWHHPPYVEKRIESPPGTIAGPLLPDRPPLSTFHGLPWPINGKRLREVVAANRAKGLKTLFYACPTTFQNDMPEHKLYGPEWDFIPQQGYAESRAACPESSWQDYFAWAIDGILRKTDADGIYWDNFNLWSCKNRAHGHGYTTPGGRERGEFPVLGMREFYKRTYVTLRKYKPDGVILGHSSGMIFIPALSFVDIYLDGEQLVAAVKTDHIATLPLEYIRAEFMGRQWGLAPWFLPSLTRPEIKRPLTPVDIEPTENMLALLAIHDIHIWAAWCNMGMIYKFHEAEDKFGVDEAEFHPYWSQKLAAPTEEKVCVSLYTRPSRDKVLMLAANLGAKPLTDRIKLDLKALSLENSRVKVTDLMTDGQTYKKFTIPSAGPIALRGDELAVPIRAKSLRVILLEKVE